MVRHYESLILRSAVICTISLGVVYNARKGSLCGGLVFGEIINIGRTPKTNSEGASALGEASSFTVLIASCSTCSFSSVECERRI